MELDAGEFLRRYLLHVLPERFVRIRYFGFMANRVRSCVADLLLTPTVMEYRVDEKQVRVFSGKCALVRQRAPLNGVHFGPEVHMPDTKPVDVRDLVPRSRQLPHRASAL